MISLLATAWQSEHLLWRFVRDVTGIHQLQDGAAGIPVMLTHEVLSFWGWVEAEQPSPCSLELLSPTSGLPEPELLEVFFALISCSQP